MKALKILHVSSGSVQILPKLGGANLGGGTEEYISNLARHLVKLGHQITLLDRGYSRHDPAYEPFEGVSLVRIHMRWLAMDSIANNPKLYSRVYHTLYIINALRFGLKARLWLRSHDDFDIIHIHDLFIGLPVLLFNSRLQMKAFYTQHGIGFQSTDTCISMRVYNALRIYLMRHVRKVIALNPSARTQFIAESRLSPKRIEYIPVGVDVTRFPDRNQVSVVRQKFRVKECLVLFTGRIAQQKGLEILIHAANLVVNDYGYSQSLFILVGPWEHFGAASNVSSYVERLYDLIHEFKLEDNVRLVGRLPREQVLALYSICNVFVLPSLVETFPQVVTEAMAHAKPVVASRLPGTSIQIMSGWNGWLVEPGDAFQLAQKIKWLLDNPRIARQMGTRGRRLVLERFDTRRIARFLADAYLTK